MGDSNLARVRAQQKFARQQAAFFYVTSSYAEVRELPLVAAQVPDHDMRPNKTLSAGSLGLHFLIDTERCTERALHGAPELQQAWFQLVRGNASIDSDLARRTIIACGAAYLAANLTDYFRPSIKRKRGERVQA